MTKRWRYGLLLFGGYIVFLIWTAPAQFALSAVRLPSTLMLAGVRGSIWSGHAVLMTTGATRSHVLSHLRFHVRLPALLHGRWAYTVQAHGPVAGHLTVAADTDRVMLSRVALHAPVSVLAPWFAALSDAGVRGAVFVRSPACVLGADPRGHGVVTWHHAGLASLPVDPLGTYRVAWTMTSAGLAYTIRTLHGKLAIAGHGRYRMHAGLVSFSGLVTPRGLRLQGLFSNFGTAAPGGARRIRLRLPLAAL